MGRRYDDIRMVCVPLLVSALRNDTPDKKNWTRVHEVIEGHFRGDLRHVADTLSLLWKPVHQDYGTSSTAASKGILTVRLFLVRHRRGILSFRSANKYQQSCKFRYPPDGNSKINSRRGLL